MFKWTVMFVQETTFFTETIEIWAMHTTQALHRGRLESKIPEESLVEISVKKIL